MTESGYFYNSKENTDICKTKEYYLRNVKRIAKINMAFKLMQYIPCLVLILLFILPLIKANFLSEQVNISILDMLISTSTTYTVKGNVATILSADLCNIPIEKYNNFFMALLEIFASSDVSYIGNLILFFSFFAFIIYFVLRSIIGIIPCLIKANVERSLKHTNMETLKQIHALDFYSIESNHKTAELLKAKGFIGNLIGFLFLIVVSVYFPCKILAFLYGVESITVNPIFTIFTIISLLMVIFGQVCSYYYGIKYHYTLQISKLLKGIKQERNRF